jgi:hypothetical protein
MKATDLIKVLATLVAEGGDLEVYVSTGEPGHYRKAHGSNSKASAVHQAMGKRSLYVDGAKAQTLGYDPHNATRGITLS